MRKKNGKKTFLAAFLAAGLAVLAILGVVFLLRARYYRDHFFPGTVMGGVDVSKLTEEEATEKVSDFWSDYLLKIRARNDEEYFIDGPAIGYSYVPNGEIGEILAAQDEYDWIGGSRRRSVHDIMLSTTYDPDMLEAAVKDLPCMREDAMIAPEDARIAWVDGAGYRLFAEVMGTTLDFDKVLDVVTHAVESRETEADLEDCYINPKIYRDNKKLNKCIKTIDNYYGCSITYTFGKQDPYELTSETIQSWLSVDEDYKVSVDDARVTEFVQQLASRFNTYGDVRRFETSLGDEIEIGGGDYGWVIDKDKEKARIYKDLKKGGHIEREPVYSQSAIKHGADDIGKTYVEIDYTNQHLWYYEKGRLIIDTDIVSGNIGRGNGSPDGIFKIVYKQRDATLVGEGYSSPVSYFMPFAYNVGIHDASWRDKFGGNIYLSSGSHGCVNVPPDVAENLYGKIEVGTPVVAYYREPVYLTAENARISNAYSYISEEDYEEMQKKPQESTPGESDQRER